jgi:hypothetical protein
VHGGRGTKAEWSTHSLRRTWSWLCNQSPSASTAMSVQGNTARYSSTHFRRLFHIASTRGAARVLYHAESSSKFESPRLLRLSLKRSEVNEISMPEGLAKNQPHGMLAQHPNCADKGKIFSGPVRCAVAADLRFTSGRVMNIEHE